MHVEKKNRARTFKKNLKASNLYIVSVLYKDFDEHILGPINLYYLFIYLYIYLFFIFFLVFSLSSFFRVKMYNRDSESSHSQPTALSWNKRQTINGGVVKSVCLTCIPTADTILALV